MQIRGFSVQEAQKVAKGNFFAQIKKPFTVLRPVLLEIVMPTELKIANL